ncbi:DUF1801 domain-containing protein [Streptosporangium minutum]|uniref:DUF1801 domain-containing protein n=1 Tax=Streptosporangium minutum TaxID=569862 RepID=UPI001F6014DE|nr:DUF1801 domain-containing protein [Streptosporangium minutum]
MAKFATVRDYLASLPESQREITGELLPLIEAALPGAGAVWQGHPVWSLGPAPGRTPVCYVKAYSAYVTFGFWRGQEIADPSGRLEPGARQMAGACSVPVAPTGAAPPAIPGVHGARRLR